MTRVILKKSGSEYFREHFNTRARADAWVAEEKTRPYWDTETGVELVELPEKTKAEVDAELAALNAARVQELQDASSVAALRAWIEKYM